MATWKSDAQKEKEKSFRRLVLMAVGVGGLLFTLIFGVLIYRLLTFETVLEEPNLESVVAGPVSGSGPVLTAVPTATPFPERPSGSAGFAPKGISAGIPSEKFIERLLSNTTTVSESAIPQLTHNVEPQKKGPLQVEFTISANGRTHSHSVGRATSTTTDIVGAAAEWQVRPWWRPGWVHQTVDCGEEGTASIGGHVSWGSKPGPFYYLGALNEGDIIRCLSSDALWYQYRVTEVVRIDYSETEFYWQSRSDLHPKQLTLFSCTPEITGIVVVRAELFTEVAAASGRDQSPVNSEP